MVSPGSPGRVLLLALCWLTSALSWQHAEVLRASLSVTSLDSARLPAGSPGPWLLGAAHRTKGEVAALVVVSAQGCPYRGGHSSDVELWRLPLDVLVARVGCWRHWWGRGHCSAYSAGVLRVLRHWVTAVTVLPAFHRVHRAAKEPHGLLERHALRNIKFGCWIPKALVVRGSRGAGVHVGAPGDVVVRGKPRGGGHAPVLGWC